MRALVAGPVVAVDDTREMKLGGATFAVADVYLEPADPRLRPDRVTVPITLGLPGVGELVSYEVEVFALKSNEHGSWLVCRAVERVELVVSPVVRSPAHSSAA